jgi:catalase
MRNKLKKILFASIALFVFAACQTKPTSRNVAQDPMADLSPTDPRIEGMDLKLVQKISDLFKSGMTARSGTTEAPKKYLGSDHVRRAVFLKTHGCAKGTFEISDKLDSSLKVGLFSSGFKKTAYVRLSSDTSPDTPDQQNSTVGISIKILDVDGKKLLPGEENFRTHDFILQNHPVFFVNNLADFLSIFSDPPDEITNQPGGKDLLAKYHQILDVDMVKEVPNVMLSNYWSTTTYQFGADHIAKYKVIPCVTVKSGVSEDPNYLAKTMKKDFAVHGGCFDFQVQLRPNDSNAAQIAEHASDDWDEKLFPPQTVGRVTIPTQNIDVNAAKCEDMSFTAWHALPEHKPMGSINKGRGLIYKMLGDYRRHERNGLPIQEPTE